MEVFSKAGDLVLPEGLRAGGYREGRDGVALVEFRGKACGVFTTNKIKAAPVKLTKKILRRGIIEGIIANSGNANAFTGKRGLEDARKMAEIYARLGGLDPSHTAVASTGVIGRYLDMELIERLASRAFDQMDDTVNGFEKAGRAIMTTDTFPKLVSVLEGDLVITGVAKGAGMISPSMATMLAFLFTNARFKPAEMRSLLRKSTDKSFNMVNVDGDTSTNDMVILSASGEIDVPERKFQKMLDMACIELARMMAKDGEGSTKFIEVEVTGAASFNDARRVAKAVTSSNLVKTAIFGGDPNWGRIVAAVGYSKAKVSEEKITLKMEVGGKEYVLVDRGITGNENVYEDLRTTLKKSEDVRIIIDLGMGGRSAVSWGCDLTPEYVRLNAEYTT